MKLKIVLIALLGMFLYITPIEATELKPGEVEYNQEPIDSFTGQLESEIAMQSGDTVRISSEWTYNYKTSLFTRSVGSAGGRTITSTVADGMMTNKAVSLNLEEVPGIQIHHNGQKVENIDATNITQAGSYVLLLNSQRIMEFTIVGEYSNINGFVCPSGFYIEDVTLDGVAVAYKSTQVDMTTDGSYEVRYTCSASNITYSVKTIIDHVAPTLALEAVEEDGKARGPVDISDVEEGGRIEIMRDEVEMEYTKTLTESGVYSLTVYDAAGNYETYDFIIMIYFNVSSITFLLMILLIIGGIAAYVVISAKRFRVY